MPTNSPDQQITTPTDPDVADNPFAFVDFLADVENRLVRRYTNDADRTARDLSPAAGQVTWNGTMLDLYDGTRYREILPVFSQLTVDSAANNTTGFVNTGLSVPIRSNGGYEMDVRVAYASPATADIKFQWTTPVLMGARYTYTGIPQAGAAFLDQVATEATVLNMEGAATDKTVFMKGVITNGANAGNLVLQFAQFAASGTPTLIRARSYIKLTRIA